MHPALAILLIYMGVNKITFVVLLFFLYPGKELLPDSEKFKNRMLHVLLLC